MEKYMWYFPDSIYQDTISNKEDAKLLNSNKYY